MANEPERPIERLLRRYADYRLRKAGKSLDLHPANRRMLQAEVARVLGAKTSRTGGGLAWLAAWWSRLAIGGVGFAAAGLLVWGFLGVNHQEQPIRELADKGPSPLPGIAATAPSETKNEPVTVARSEVAPALARGATSNFYEHETGTSTFSLSQNKDVDQQVASFQAGASAQPALAQDTLFVARPQEEPRAKEMEQLTRQYARLPEQAKLAGAAAGAPSTILSAFRVEQTGQDLRVIDKDGSVYSGKLFASQAPSSSIAARDYQVEKVQTLEKSASLSAAKRMAAPAAPVQAAQAFSFRVMGTNVNSKQQVIFTGQLLPLDKNVALAMTNAAAAGIGGRLVAPTQQVISTWPDYRISGKAVVNGGSEIQIDAEPSR